MRQVGEPSVEEILDSIKKVIARDSRDSAAELRRERGPVSETAPEPMIEADDDDVLDLGAIGEAIGEDSDMAVADSQAPLIADIAASSISESLAALAVMAEPRAAPQIVRSGETSLEGLVREMLRPALAEWLDKNLPPLVEKLVAAEIARIVGKKG
jgi:cell pole-organizing protein PopZ